METTPRPLTPTEQLIADLMPAYEKAHKAALRAIKRTSRCSTKHHLAAWDGTPAEAATAWADLEEARRKERSALATWNAISKQRSELSERRGEELLKYLLLPAKH